MGTIIQMPIDSNQRLTLETGGPHFAVTRKINADCTKMLVRVVGEVDLLTAPMLAEVLELARRDTRSLADIKDIIVDLRLVVFLGAAGLAVLARASDSCARDDVGFRVVATHSAVTRPLTITRLDQQVRLCPHPDATGG